ncbi:MAG: MotA/TolQ/ExbB proton channel family protein [Chitinispirillaceae bacterium]|nr:MotA/TolQ/ExbB proton channel family protein [Chitinispirillaceae bacterium]
MMQTIALQFNNGGIFMWVILGVFGFGLAVAIERLIYFFIYCNDGAKGSVTKVIDSLHRKDITNTKQIIGKRKTPFFKLLEIAVDRYINGSSVERIMEGVERLSINELARITRRVNYLALIANIATLLGLLGTITGLQTSFGSLATADAAQKATLLANGISEAMNTTAFGLIVAVPCMILYTILNNKQQSLIKEIDNGIALFIDIVKEERK